MREKRGPGHQMSVRTLCLAILEREDATGYEIRKMSTEGKFRYFVEASFGSIYPTLARLESEGLVTVREERQSGKPTRKVYSITDAGRAEFVRALCEPPAPDTFRSPFLLVAMCADIVGPQVIGRAIDLRIKSLREEAAFLDATAQETGGHAPTGFIIDYGRHCIAADIGFLEANRQILEDIARDAGPAVAQAAE